MLHTKTNKTTLNEKLTILQQKFQVLKITGPLILILSATELTLNSVRSLFDSQSFHYTVPLMDASPRLVYCGIEPARFPASSFRKNRVSVRRRTRKVFAVASEPKPKQTGTGPASSSSPSKTVNGSSRSSPPLKPVNGASMVDFQITFISSKLPKYIYIYYNNIRLLIVFYLL